MATVVRNQDNTFTVTPTTQDLRILQRWGEETSVSRAERIEVSLNELLRMKLREYRSRDGSLMNAKYNACTVEQKAAIDAILAGVTPEP